MRLSDSFIACGMGAIALLAGCGGGGGSGGASPNPPPATPTPRVSLTLSSDRQLLTVGQLGLRYTPDEHTSLVQQPGGAYWVWIAASVNRQHGSAALLSTTDETTFAPVVGSGGVASPVFGPPSPSQGDTFDNYYAAPGSVLSIGGGYIMIFHGEDHTWNGQTYPYPFYATVGLATSPDGIHWTTVGPLITARDPKSATVPQAGTGAAVPSAIVANDGYVYAFYTDYPSPGYPDYGTPGLIQVARAPAAQAASPSAWLKYYNGSFSESATNYGNSTPVVPVPASNCPPQRQAGISYNTYLGAYLLTFVCNAGWYYTTSSDLVHWAQPTQFYTAPFPNNSLVPGQEFDWYPTLFTPGQSSNQTTGQTGYVFYAKGLWQTTPHELWRQSFSFSR